LSFLWCRRVPDAEVATPRNFCVRRYLPPLMDAATPLVEAAQLYDTPVCNKMTQGSYRATRPATGGQAR